MSAPLLWIVIVALGAAGVILVFRSMRSPRVAPPRPLPTTREPDASPESTEDIEADTQSSEAAGSEPEDESSAASRDDDDAPVDDAPSVDLAGGGDTDDDSPTMPFALILVTAVGETDPGRRRQRNEDAYLVMSEQHLFVIADGMGGHAAGEIASKLAIETIAEAFLKGTFDGDSDPERPRRGDELVRAIQMANAAVHAQAGNVEEQIGMGTTVVATRFSPDKQRVYVAHVGDSRCYRLRGNKLRQLTRDHTLGAYGIKGPSAAKLMRAVGTEPVVEVDLFTDGPEGGDYYLLCSDGLSRMVPDDVIAQIVIDNSDLTTAVQTLVREANERGGKDNITVILIRVEEGPEVLTSRQSLPPAATQPPPAS